MRCHYIMWLYSGIHFTLLNQPLYSPLLIRRLMAVKSAKMICDVCGSRVT